ncbi:heptaprenyl diphosphate synthase component 1 [Sporolactobacillus sp. CQH2019]|uniref:heptaprenyl diphosphate synthase component 1 n=1 Tax=Sporolactobacillus sp. CQH2019 TaxID=3023512 RepID=UPI002367A695|nr:heptaprenyl diphosphate synthase component 1 [Sporolactobacillus sp. CQH2019]MDD9148655.1 heptaprenyl diphosphate synthase component 1 [Sporolactobacillus sp. CQH2019]
MTVREEIENIYAKIRHDLSHPYVNKYLPFPEIDKDKLLVYYYLFQKRSEDGGTGVYVESLMAAEIGLSAHESMTTERLNGKNEIKIRQLTALSGDFYSALYYYYLSRKPDIEVVKWIAEAIQTFNVNKCLLFYPNHTLNWTQAVTALESIESALVAKIAAKLGFEDWVPSLNAFFLTKKLVYEYELQTNGGSHSFLCNYLIDSLPHASVPFRERLEEEIKHAKERFFDSIKKVEKNSGVLSRLLPYLTEKMNAFCRFTVEEG